MMTEHDHVPVMEQEVLSAFNEQAQAPLRFFEGTLGRGGHTMSLLRNFPESKVISFDKDLTAIEFGKQKFSELISQGRLELIHDDFKNLLVSIL